MCKSGVCGHENCCADSSCPSTAVCNSDGTCLASSSDDGSDPHGAPTLTPTPTPTPVDSSGSGGTGEHSPCGGSAAAGPRATGGNVSTVGNYTIHTFTSNGTFTVSDATLTELDVLVVGGGGGGGRSVGGGGGGGAVLTARIERQSYPNEAFTVVVGGGGGGSIGGGVQQRQASEGGESSFAGRAALGGQPGRDLGMMGEADGGRSGACEGYGPFVCNGFDVSGDSFLGRRRARRRLLFSHDATENCENVCEGHGYDAGMCISFTGCQWDSGTQECHSAVGSAPCDSGAPGGDSFENCEYVCDAYDGNEPSCVVTTGCEYDRASADCRSKVGSAPCDSGDNCEVVCQSNSYDEWQCNSVVTGCQWDDANLKCLSTVGPNPCDGSGSVNSYPDDATFCPSWAKYKICSNMWNEASCNAAAECVYENDNCKPAYTASDVDVMQLQSYEFDSSTCSFSSANACDQAGCRWDDFYDSCVLTLDHKEQELAAAGVPDGAASWILMNDGHAQLECYGRDQASCENLSPMCLFHTECYADYYLYGSWLVISACQSAMSSDMSLLDAAANANHEIFDGVAQLETWMTTGAYSPSAAAFCDAWRESKVCSGSMSQNDQATCESFSSAHGCTWGETPWSEGMMTCLNSDGRFGESDYLMSIWIWYDSIVTRATNCHLLHGTEESCNQQASDCDYVLYPSLEGTGTIGLCETKFLRRLEILENAGVPAHAVNYIAHSHSWSYCNASSVESSCEAPYCRWESYNSECRPHFENSIWTVAAACGEPYVSDDNLAAANGFPNMAALQSAAISGDSAYSGPPAYSGDSGGSSSGHASNQTWRPGGVNAVAGGGGGGGGAGEAALQTTGTNGTEGGDGIISDISGSARYYGGGGGGAHYSE